MLPGNKRRAEVALEEATEPMESCLRNDRLLAFLNRRTYQIDIETY
jgi:hypothetical protein